MLPCLLVSVQIITSSCSASSSGGTYMPGHTCTMLGSGTTCNRCTVSPADDTARCDGVKDDIIAANCLSAHPVCICFLLPTGKLALIPVCEQGEIGSGRRLAEGLFAYVSVIDWQQQCACAILSGFRASGGPGGLLLLWSSCRGLPHMRHLGTT